MAAAASFSLSRDRDFHGGRAPVLFIARSLGQTPPGSLRAPSGPPDTVSLFAESLSRTFGLRAPSPRSRTRVFEDFAFH